MLAERSLNFEKDFVEERVTAEQLRTELKATQPKLKKAEVTKESVQSQLQMAKAEQKKLKANQFSKGQSVF